MMRKLCLLLALLLLALPLGAVAEGLDGDWHMAMMFDPLSMPLTGEPAGVADIPEDMAAVMSLENPQMAALDGAYLFYERQGGELAALGLARPEESGWVLYFSQGASPVRFEADRMIGPEGDAVACALEGDVLRMSDGAEEMSGPVSFYGEGAFVFRFTEEPVTYPVSMGVPWLLFVRSDLLN